MFGRLGCGCLPVFFVFVRAVFDLYKVVNGLMIVKGFQYIRVKNRSGLSTQTTMKSKRKELDHNEDPLKHDPCVQL